MHLGRRGYITPERAAKLVAAGFRTELSEDQLEQLLATLKQKVGDVVDGISWTILREGTDLSDAVNNFWKAEPSGKGILLALHVALYVAFEGEMEDLFRFSKLIGVPLARFAAALVVCGMELSGSTGGSERPKNLAYYFRLFAWKFTPIHNNSTYTGFNVFKRNNSLNDAAACAGYSPDPERNMPHKYSFDGGKTAIEKIGRYFGNVDPFRPHASCETMDQLRQLGTLPEAPQQEIVETLVEEVKENGYIEEERLQKLLDEAWSQEGSIDVSTPMFDSVACLRVIMAFDKEFSGQKHSRQAATLASPSLLLPAVNIQFTDSDGKTPICYLECDGVCQYRIASGGTSSSTDTTPTRSASSAGAGAGTINVTLDPTDTKLLTSGFVDTGSSSAVGKKTVCVPKVVRLPGQLSDDSTHQTLLAWDIPSKRQLYRMMVTERKGKPTITTTTKVERPPGLELCFVDNDWFLRRDKIEHRLTDKKGKWAGRNYLELYNTDKHAYIPLFEDPENGTLTFAVVDHFSTLLVVKFELGGSIVDALIKAAKEKGQWQELSEIFTDDSLFNCRKLLTEVSP